MPQTRTLQHETNTAAAETAETASQAVKDTSERAAQEATERVERATKAASDAAERVLKAVADASAAGDIDGEAILLSARDGISSAVQIQQQALGSMERASTSILTGVSEMQKEIAGFVSERIRQDLETQHELLSCRTMGELREVQTRFLRTTIDQYSTEATKLIQLGAQVFRRANGS
jgi:hypothetical protein